MSVRILVGDVRERLAELPDNSIQCVVTSPPYFGLRDYGTAQWDGGDPACDHVDAERPIAFGPKNTLGPSGGLPMTNAAATARVQQYRAVCGKCGATRIDSQIGLETTLADYLDTLVAVFREVRRVLRDDGTLWLNIGDSYASGNPCDRRNVIGNGSPDESMQRRSRLHGGLKEKDLMLVPFRLAIALQDDGWYVRSDIIWAKRAPMPESVTDRPTSAHEHIFLLTKKPRYFYDAQAVAEDADSGLHKLQSHHDPNNGKYAAVPHDRYLDQFDGRVWGQVGTRNQRNVWHLGPEPFPSAHFATFVTEIPRRAIKAGTSERGCCGACGSPWMRQTSTAYDNPGNRTTNGPRSVENRAFTAGFEVRLEKRVETTGWAPSCACGAAVVPCVVLDPFLGSGTTLLVADQLGRDGIGIELNPEYAAMAERRITGDAPMFAAVAVT